MTIKHIIEPRIKDLGEFSVRRILPYAKQRMVGPWIFFDHMGPANFSAGNGVNVRPHPHINLATVTYLFAGEIFHRDSLGNAQSIYPGDINLMVAGKGIVHSERERGEVHDKNHHMHGLQLWHALPEEFEEIAPAFYHYEASKMPRFNLGNISLRVMMGSAYGVTSPVKTFCETIYVEAHLQKGDKLDLPQAQELAFYVVSGDVEIAGKKISSYQMVILNEGRQANIHAISETRMVIIGGAKMTERFIEWNFVSSRKERIEQAKNDWRAGRFPKIAGDDKEFIPLPEDIAK